MSSPSSTTVKLYFTLPAGKQEIRRFTTAAPEVLPALLAFLSATYERHFSPPLHFNVAYDDGEDLCSVNTETELQEGLQLHAASGAAGVLKLVCSIDESPIVVPQSPSAITPVTTTTTESPVIVQEDPKAAAAPDSDDEYDRIEEGDSASSPAAPVEVKVEAEAEVTPRVEDASSPQVSIEDVTSHPSEHADAATWLWGGEPSSVPAPAVHTGVSCDLCGMGPIVGSRFHCLSCVVPGGFDLCGVCEASEGHFPLSHQLVEFKTLEDAKAAKANKAAEVEQQVGAAAVTSNSSSSSSSSSSVPATVSAAAVAPSSTPTPVVHAGVSCDGCRASPLTGNRYHCTTCTVPGGFDLCEACESAGDKHPASHVMMKMRTATPSGVAPVAERALSQVGIIRAAAGDRCARPRPWDFTPAAERPKAQFISDVTCADGMQVRAGETLRKTWSIKNVGSTAWPAGVVLTFVGGDLAPESDGVSKDSDTPAHGALVPFAGPGDVVHVSIDIVVPNEPGRFRGTFRLQTKEGERFGARCWIDLTVPEVKAEEEVVAPATPVAAPVAAVEPIAAVESKQSEEEKASSSLPVTSGAWGRPLRLVPLDNSASEAALAAEFRAAHIAAEVNPIPAAGSAQSHSSSASASSPFQYSNQLAILRSMGFVDVQLNKYLLLNNKGDLEHVVNWLVSNATNANIAALL